MQRPFPFLYITGGCRSGKSAFAQRTAEAMAPERLFLATAQALDAEMRDRIRLHQEARGPGWRLHECPQGGGAELWRDLAGLVREEEPLLFDCLTLWAAGLMLSDEEPPAFAENCDRLLAALWSLPCPVLVVGNEVGMGLVPPTASGRAFRDMAGLAGQKAAALSTDVIFMVSGIPLAVKGRLPCQAET